MVNLFRFYSDLLNDCFTLAEKERGNKLYVEEKLNKALSQRLKDIDDKIENAEHSRSFFGEEMYRKLIEIDESRSEALVLDRRKQHSFVFLFILIIIVILLIRH